MHGYGKQINHCNGFEIGPPNLVRLFICHLSWPCCLHHSYIPEAQLHQTSCLRNVVFTSGFTLMFNICKHGSVHLLPWGGCSVRLEYIYHHISIMYLSIYPSIHPSIIFIPKCGPETITVTRPDVIQPFCFSLIS